MGVFENYLIGHEDVRSVYLVTKNGDIFIRPVQDLPNFAEKASPVSVSARGGDESVFF